MEVGWTAEEVRSLARAAPRIGSPSAEAVRQAFRSMKQGVQSAAEVGNSVECAVYLLPVGVEVVAEKEASP